MPYSSINATLGASNASPSRKRRKRKRTRTPSSVTSVNATLGGRGVKRATKARRSFDRTAARRAQADAIRAQEKIYRQQDVAQAAATIDRLNNLDTTRQVVRKANTPIGKGWKKAVTDEEVDALLTIAATAIPVAKPLRFIAGGVRATSSGAKAAQTLARARKSSPLVQANKTAPQLAAKARKAPKATPDTIKLAEKAARGKAGTRLKTATKRQVKKRKPISTKEKLATKAARRASYGPRAARYAKLGAEASGPVGVVGVSAERYGKALWEKPGETLGTTARTIPAIGTAIIAAPGTAATAIKEGDTEAFGRFLEQQKRYYDTIRKISDPSVSEDKAIQMIQEDVGLIPAITAGLTGSAISRYGFGRAPRAARSVPVVGRKARLDRAIKQRQSPDSQVRARAEEKIQKFETPRREAKAQRQAESKRQAVTGDRTEMQFNREMRISGRGRKRLDAQAVRFSKEVIDRDPITVTVADTLQFLGREGLHGMEPRRFLAELEKRAARLKPSKRPLSDTTPSTRNVINALRKNPEIASRPDVVDWLRNIAYLQRGRSIERHTESAGGVRQTTPDPADVRPQMLHVARAEDIAPPEQRIPMELRGRTKVRRKPGEDVRTQIRGEARSMRKKAAGFQRAAIELRRAGREDRAAELDGRAQRLIHEAEVREMVVNRERRAESLDRQATTAERAGDIETATRLRAEAQELRRTHVEAENQLRDEFERDVRARLAEKGQNEPVFFSARDASDRGADMGQDAYRGARLAKREKRLMGTLAQQGRIDEAGAVLLESLYRDRAGIEIRKHTRTFANERLLKNEKGEPLFVTGEEARRLQNEGKIPPGTALFPFQEMSSAFQRGAWHEAAGMLDNETMKGLRQMRGVKGKKYGLVPEPALKEFHAQTDEYSQGLKWVRTSARVQSLMLLATSPAWFSWQLAASPLTALYSHPNPVRWAKASKQHLADWRKLSEQEKIDFQTEYGGTIADAIDFGDRRMGLTPDTFRSAESAIGTAKRSPAYRAMAVVGNHFKKGGPLIQFNRRYEAEYRDLVALIQMDKEINPPRVLRFIDSVHDSHRFVEQDVKHLRGKSLQEKIRFYNDNPEAMRRLANKVDDAMGNWNALTSKERLASAVTVFYPFLRFSMRWLMKTYPKENPLRAAILANLAQSNSMELERLLGEEPSFFPDWGNIVIQAAQPTAVNMSRVAPGSNAVVESLGTGKFNTASLLRPFQPIFGITKSALDSENPLTGRPLPEGMSQLEAFVKGVAGLVPATRGVAQKIGPEPSVYSELFRRITGRKGDTKQYLVPRIETDLEREAVAARASVLMDTVFDTTNPDISSEERTAARAELYGLMRRYGLEPPGSGSSSSSSSSSSGTSLYGGSSSSGGTSLYGGSSSSSGSGVSLYGN